MPLCTIWLSSDPFDMSRASFQMTLSSIFGTLRTLLPGLVMALGCHAAVIEGLVLEDRTGKPLARARVSLEPVKEGSSAAPVFTDSNGTFQFADLVAGTYRISAERAGFVISRFGQSRFDSAASPISLPADGHFFARMRLQRPGLISGAVLDENSIGLPGFSVSAYRIAERPKLVAAVNTNERGLYRLPSLGPGRYALITSARILEDGRGLVPTFYGQATTLAQARLVDIQLDGEQTAIDISPIPGRLNSVRGQLNGPGVLAVQMLGDLGMQESPVRADGSFEFSGVPAGSYLVIAGTGSATSAAEGVTVQGEDRFVALRLGVSPVVELSCSGSGAPQKESSPGLVVFLERDLLADGEGRRLDCGKSLQVPAGRWRIRPLPLSNAYVQSLTEARTPDEGRSEAFELSLSPGDKKQIVAMLSLKTARVKGQVTINGGTPAIGMPVGLLAVADDVNRRMGGARLTRADSEGRFRFDGLAPGDYRIVTSPDLDSVAAIENFGPNGQALRLTEGEEAIIEVPWQQ